MSVGGLDIAALKRLAYRHGTVARVVVTRVQGSTPRETGAAMLIWEDGQNGTIGGGALEHDAIKHARQMLGKPGDWRRETQQVALGPNLGQCCGGAVSLLLERFTAQEASQLPQSGLSRPVTTGIAPKSVHVTAPRFDGRIFAEPALTPPSPVWLYGAGHVGRAVVDALAPFERAVTWVDILPEKFPQTIPDHASPLMAADPARVVPHAPDDALHLVMTCSHPVDMAICAAVLKRRFGYLGLIGSATKAARFKKRLRGLGLPVERMTCPIGDPSLGKAPAAIALGIAADILRLSAPAELEQLA